MSKKSNKTILIVGGIAVAAAVVIYAMSKKTTTTTSPLPISPITTPTGGTNWLTQGESLLTSLLGKSTSTGGGSSLSNLFSSIFGSSNTANNPSAGFTAGDSSWYTAPSDPFTPPDSGNYLDITGSGDTSLLA